MRRRGVPVRRKKIGVRSAWWNALWSCGDRSGHGREDGRSAVELYARVKSVWTSLHDDEVTADIRL